MLSAKFVLQFLVANLIVKHRNPQFYHDKTHTFIHSFNLIPCFVQ